jgi:hypothetical protein
VEGIASTILDVRQAILAAIVARKQFFTRKPDPVETTAHESVDQRRRPAANVRVGRKYTALAGQHKVNGRAHQEVFTVRRPAWAEASYRTGTNSTARKVNPIFLSVRSAVGFRVSFNGPACAIST